MRNRGYRFIIRDLGFDRGCAAMCINSTWINELLKDHGVDPVIFRKLKWNDLAAVCKSGRGRQIFEDLKPKNFWQMCDVVSLMYVKYDSVGNGQAYRKRWFKQYPILVEEDIYEFLLEEGFSQEEAMELTVFYKDHPEKKYRKDVRVSVPVVDLVLWVMVCRQLSELPSQPQNVVYVALWAMAVFRCVSRNLVRLWSSSLL